MTERSWASSDAARHRMQANPSRDTQPELAIRRILHKRGLRFYVNRPPIPGMRRTADILFPGSKVAVFVDGCFWHGCPTHGTKPKTNVTFWAEKLRRNQERDAETNELLEAKGWRVVRLWEHTPACEAADIVQRTLRGLAAPELDEVERD